VFSKYIGVSPSTIATIRFPSLIEEVRRSKEKGAKEDASKLKVSWLMYSSHFEIIDHWFSP
jgi:hypothetical protein